MALKHPSAKSRLRTQLRSIGLEGLTDEWYKRLQNNWSKTELWAWARETKTYQHRFAGLVALRKKGRGQDMDERGYVEYEHSLISMFAQRGLDTKFLTRDQIGKWVAGETSLEEIQQRADMATAAAYQEPQELRSELNRLYGVHEGDIALYFLSGGKSLPLLQQRFLAAQSASAAQRSGFGAIGRSEAERLAELGVSEDQAEEGFGQLYDAQELFRPLDSGEDTIGRQEQLGATFGADAAARRRIEERARRRKATFEEGGGYASSQTGFAGLGSAST